VILRAIRSISVGEGGVEIGLWLWGIEFSLEISCSDTMMKIGRFRELNWLINFRIIFFDNLNNTTVNIYIHRIAGLNLETKLRLRLAFTLHLHWGLFVVTGLILGLSDGCIILCRRQGNMCWICGDFLYN
jgi:hypothetical protein